MSIVFMERCTQSTIPKASPVCSGDPFSGSRLGIVLCVKRLYLCFGLKNISWMPVLILKLIVASVQIICEPHSPFSLHIYILFPWSKNNNKNWQFYAVFRSLWRIGFVAGTQLLVAG
jgi:hypothetical protein